MGRLYCFKLCNCYHVFVTKSVLLDSLVQSHVELLLCRHWKPLVGKIWWEYFTSCIKKINMLLTIKLFSLRGTPIYGWFYKVKFCLCYIFKNAYISAFLASILMKLYRDIAEWWKFRVVVFYLVVRALRQCFKLQCYTKLGNRDFVSKFAKRIEDSTLRFY